MIQKHCYECGAELTEKELEGEGILGVKGVIHHPAVFHRFGKPAGNVISGSAPDYLSGIQPAVIIIGCKGEHLACQHLVITPRRFRSFYLTTFCLVVSRKAHQRKIGEVMSVHIYQSYIHTDKI